MYSNNKKTRICFYSNRVPTIGGLASIFFNLTRQLIVSEDAEDDDIWQLGLTFEFEPDNELRALGRGNKWCHSPSQLLEFREYVYRSAAFTSCTEHRIRRIVIDYGVAG